MTVQMFLGALRTAQKRLEAYPATSDPETVHRMRTALRRMDSAYQVIPKAARTPSSDKVVADLMDFFRMNGRIRNLDIMLEKLQWYGYGPDSEPAMAITRLRKRRHKKTLRAARRLQHLEEPNLKDIPATPPDTEKLELDILQLVGVVSGDESKIDELHTLRKLVKQLRYTLEATPGSDAETVQCLRYLQGLMGDIHDCDMFLAYMKKHGRAMNVRPSTILAEGALRHRGYKRLATALGPGEDLQRLLYGSSQKAA